MVLAIDFDGVIHDYKNPIPGRRMGGPIPGAVEAMERLVEDGHTVIIHTVRGDSPKHIADWCEFYEVEYDNITATKPNADYYIDDKALRFTSWPQTLGEIDA